MLSKKSLDLILEFEVGGVSAFHEFRNFKFYDYIR